MTFLFDWRETVASGGGPRTPTTRHVLLTLSLHMNADGGSCFPSVRRLSKETGYHTDTVCKHLRLAVEDGWLKRQLGKLGGQAWRRASYQATVPERVRRHRTASANVSDDTGQLQSEGVRFEPEKVCGQAARRTYIEDDISISASQETHSPPRVAYTPEFEAASAAYPKRAGGDSKKAAWRCWCARVRQGASEDELEQGVVRYARFCDATGKTGSEYVMQRARFFGSDEHWREDWPVPSKNGGAPEPALANLQALS